MISGKHTRRAAITLVMVAVMVAGIAPSLTASAVETTTQETPSGTTPVSTPTSASENSESSDNSTVAVIQYSQDGVPLGCVAVEPLGNGTQTVEEFYGYQGKPDLSAVGSREIQYTDVSQIMIYNGTEGLSIVVIHDRYADSTLGGNAKMWFTSLPEEGEWVVQDDNETAPFSADRYNISANSATINWSWGTSRTDGAAFLIPSGSFEKIQVSAEFNKSEEATNSWGLRSAGQNSLIKLDMGRNYSFSTGSCPTFTQSTPTPTAQPTPTVSFNPEQPSGDTNQSGNETMNSTNSSGSDFVSIPRSFVVSNITIARETASVGQPVNITATIVNQGDETLARIIKFQTSRNSTIKRKIALKPGERQFIQFQQSYGEPGTYTIRAGSAKATIKIVSSASGPGFGIIPALIVILLSAFIARKRIGDQNSGNEGE